MGLRRFLFLALAASLLRAGEAVLDPAITENDLRGHVERLASDEWEGRGSGTEGEKRATEYIAGLFERLGFEKAGEQGSWFQEVRMPDAMKVGAACALELRGDPGVAPFAVDEDWRPFSSSSSGVAEGDLVFAGYGITAPELGYDDYAGLDVRGKVVVIFRHAPHGAPAWRGARGKHAPFTVKLAQAAKGGAIGVLVVNDPHNFPAPDPAAPRRRRGRRDRVHRGGTGGSSVGIPYAHLTLAAARRFFPAAFGATPEQLEAAIHEGERPVPASRAGLRHVRLAVDVEHTFLTGRNVCGLLRAGAADALDEVVVVGAHHDHLGRGGGRGSLARSPEERQRIHNGADDNASGTSGLLEVATYLASRSAELKRSVLFVTFTGEERGLLGSRYYVDQPTVPLAKMAAMINMDMIGRLDGRKLFVGGVKTSPVFKPLLDRACEKAGVEAVYGDGGRAPSDNTSFYNKKMPVLFFFSGLHRDYHRPSDDAAKIDGAGMEKIARLCAATVEAVASLPERPPFQRADQGGMGPPRAILGIQAGADPNGVQIARLTPNGPAAKAGLAEGDVIVAIAGKKTPDLAALQDVMRALQIGQAVKVEVRRGDATETVELALGRG